MQIKEYQIILGWPDDKDGKDVSDLLSFKVNEAIKKGWEPLGGVSYAGYSQKVAQAMVIRG